MLKTILGIGDKMGVLCHCCMIFLISGSTSMVIWGFFGVFGGVGACNCSADVMDCVGHTLLLAEQTEEYSLLLGGIESKLSSDAIGCSGTA